jgi:hypothetical protein
MSHNVGNAAERMLASGLRFGGSGAYTEITVNGITPQLPINEGLTIHPETD